MPPPTELTAKPGFRDPPILGAPTWNPGQIARLGAAVFAVALLYLPILRHEFATPDDYLFLRDAAEHGFSLDGILAPYNQHFLPLYRLYFTVQFKLFGLHPSGYYALSILQHAANMVLLAIFVGILTGSAWTGVLAAAIFGFSAAHWEPVAWILASNSSLAVLFYLLAALCLLLHLRSRSRILLGLSLALHACVFLTFSYGVEAPVLFGALAFVAGGRDLRISLRYAGIYGLNALLLLGFRKLLGSIYPTYGFSEPSDFAYLLGFLPRSALYLFGGIVEGFAKSYTGAYGFEHWIAALWMGVGALAACLLIDWRNEGLRKSAPAALCLLLWGLVFYYEPVIARGGIGYRASFLGHLVSRLGYDEFIVTNRYRYAPGICFAGVAAILVRHLRFSGVGRPGIVWRYVLLALGGGIFLANAVEIRAQLRELGDNAAKFANIREEFLRGVHAAVEAAGTDGIQIFDEYFVRDISTGRFVNPGVLVTAFAPADKPRITFVYRAPPKNLKDALQSGRLFAVQPDGKLFKVSREADLPANPWKPAAGVHPESKQNQKPEQKP